MAEFLAELRRRHMYRIGGIYVVVAWGITQVLDVLSQMFALPDWIAQPSLVALTIGFPVVLIAAWTIVGAAKSSDTPAELKKATTTDWVLIGALALVIVLLGYQRLSLTDPASSTAVATSDAAASIADEIIQNVAGRLPNSVAVLPFANVSPNPDDEYFAVGIHDEVLNKLQSLQNVRVIARASVMKYADTTMTIPEIADELNVETIMSGSVRLAGDQVLVNAELIDGESNLTVWSDQYPGDLSDIFGIQADIAMNIANALRAEFSAEEQENIETRPTDSPEAYTLYLKAQALIQGDIIGVGEVASRRLVQEYLDEALTIDPGFALAHAWKAEIYRMQKRFDPVDEEDWSDYSLEMNRLISEHTRLALEIDPELAFAYVQRARNNRADGRLDATREDLETALRLAPNEPEALIDMAFYLLYVGQLDEAIRYYRRAIELNPNSSQAHNDFGTLFHYAGMQDEAMESLQECLRLNPGDGGCLRSIGFVEFMRGNDEESFEAFRVAELTQGFTTAAVVAYGYGLLGRSEDAQRAFDTFSALASERYADPGVWALAYMGIGDYDEALIRLNALADNPELLKDAPRSRFIIGNYVNNPRLEESDFVEVRTKLASVL